MGVEQLDEHSALSRERWELDSRPADVIAIGSQVVYGTVGLSASVPVLTERGLKVAALPTAMLSNLPHYPQVHAADLSGPWVADALHDLTALGIADEVSTVYTGYFAGPAQVIAVAGWLRVLLERRPQLRVVVDPTLGDYDVGAYTDPEVASALRKELLPLATGIVPNLFELQHLLESSPERDQPVDQIIKDARRLLHGRCQWVVATGLDGQDRQHGEDLVVTADEVAAIGYERLDVRVKGTGDVMAASIVAGLHQGLDIADSVEQAGTAVRRRLEARRIGRI
ncbi:pyridoxal kinase [Glutamicibacter protophormiae]|nr:pyridoxal kinase [Glutamicibacter protophormiae]